MHPKNSEFVTSMELDVIENALFDCNLYANLYHAGPNLTNCLEIRRVIINSYQLFVCKIPLLARAHCQARATIGYLVYKSVIRS